MPLRNVRRVTWRPATASDAVDGSVAPPGAMSILTNLVPDPATANVYVPRPAALKKADFRTFNGAKYVTAGAVIGDLFYGMVATNRNAPKDEPFVYDIANDAFITVSGITAANVPTSPPATGDWTPPIVRQVGSRVIVTHPGFPGDTIKFGWFDISGFSLDSIGNLAETISFSGDTDTGDPGWIHGLPPNSFPETAFNGLTVTGTNIPANTTITGTGTEAVAFFGDTHSNTTIDNLTIDGSTPGTAGIYVGQVIGGSGIPVGATVATLNRGAFSMTISVAATSTVTANALASAGEKVSISNDATGTADGTVFSIVSTSLITGAIPTDGVQPGLTVTGSGVPADTQVQTIAAEVAQYSADLIAGANIVFVNVFSTVISTGMTVAGFGIQPGTTVLAVGDGRPANPVTNVVLSAAVTASGSGVVLTFTGAVITVTQNLTPATGVSLTFAGGTTSAPLWGAGDTSPNALPSTPLGVEEMFGRAYYACGTDGLPFSDSLFPCLQTNATQVLKPGNGLAVTALGKATLSTLSGGVIQTLFAFQRDDDMQQITGDQSLGNLSIVDLKTATGTHAPLTICSGTGLCYFVSPDGLRMVDLQGRVSQPIGVAGSGVTQPFQNSPFPSRMAAAVNGRVIRIQTPTTGVAYEFWYHLNRGSWTGPHTVAGAIIATWTNSFVLFPDPSVTPELLPELWTSDDAPSSGSTYVENGADLSWGYSTILLPDNQEGAMNAMVEATLALSYLESLDAVTVSFTDEMGNVIDSVTLAGTAAAPGWGGFTWGGQIWAAQGPAYQQRKLPWTIPVVFKQGRFVAQGQSDASVRIGNIYMKHEILGYQLGVAV